MDFHAASIKTRFEDILSGRSAWPLVAIWNTAPFLNALAGVDLKAYYYDPAVKLGVQLGFQERFPEILNLPGIWADFGALAEPSAFGCEIGWPDQGMPMAQPILKTKGEVRSLRVPDPTRDGLLPRALDDYRYFWARLDRRLIEDYGYLDGVAASFGPVELAAVLMGHAAFYMHLVSDPALVHGLLEVTTEFVIHWLESHQAVNGPLRRIALADHLPGQISLAHFQEFWKPYTQRVIAQWPGAMILYHNEYPIPYPQALAGLGIDVFHFGGPVARLKSALGGETTLMGNLDPVRMLLSATPEEVRAESLRVLDQGAAGGRFLLSSGGGLAPDTPPANLAAMLRAVAGRPLGKGEEPDGV